MLKKILSSFLIFLFLFNFVAQIKSAQAQTLLQGDGWYSQTFTGWYTRVYDEKDNEIYGERYTAAQVQWIMYAIPANLINVFAPKELVICLLTISSLNLNLDECAGAVAEYMSGFGNVLLNENTQTKRNYLAEYYETTPISGIKYFHDKINKLKISSVQAQEGFGFNTFDRGPIQKLWKATRDASYALIVFASIILAFMIMFRVKVSPQLVITAQTAIPKIAFALIFITFSYAIAGLMIDLMNVSIAIVILIFRASGVMTTNVFDSFNFLINGRVANTGGHVDLGLITLYTYYMVSFVVAYIAATLSAVGEFTLIGVVGGLLTFIAGFLIIPVVIIYSFIHFFKLMITTLKIYIGIIASIILAPLIILAGVVSNGFGFGKWLKELAINLATFPAMALFWILAFMFLQMSIGKLDDIFDTIGTSGNLGLTFHPTLADGSTWNPPFAFGASLDPILWLMVSFFSFTFIPKAAEIVKGALSGKGFAYGSAIGEARGALPMAVGAYAGMNLGESWSEKSFPRQIVGMGIDHLNPIGRNARRISELENMAKSSGLDASQKAALATRQGIQKFIRGGK